MTIEKTGILPFKAALSPDLGLAVIDSPRNELGQRVRPQTARLTYLKDLQRFLAQPDIQALQDSLNKSDSRIGSLQSRLEELQEADVEGLKKKNQNYFEADAKKKKSDSLVAHIQSAVAAEKLEKVKENLADDAKEIRKENFNLMIYQREVKRKKRSEEITGLVEHWALQSELRVLGYAYYTLRDDYKRRVWFERYGEFEGQDPKEVQIFLEEKYQHFANPANPQLT